MRACRYKKYILLGITLAAECFFGGSLAGANDRLQKKISSQDRLINKKVQPSVICYPRVDAAQLKKNSEGVDYFEIPPWLQIIDSDTFNLLKNPEYASLAGRTKLMIAEHPQYQLSVISDLSLDVVRDPRSGMMQLIERGKSPNIAIFDSPSTEDRLITAFSSKKSPNQIAFIAEFFLKRNFYIFYKFNPGQKVLVSEIFNSQTNDPVILDQAKFIFKAMVFGCLPDSFFKNKIDMQHKSDAYKTLGVVFEALKLARFHPEKLTMHFLNLETEKIKFDLESDFWDEYARQILSAMVLNESNNKKNIFTESEVIDFLRKVIVSPKSSPELYRYSQWLVDQSGLDENKIETLRINQDSIKLPYQENKFLNSSFEEDLLGNTLYLQGLMARLNEFSDEDLKCNDLTHFESRVSSESAQRIIDILNLVWKNFKKNKNPDIKTLSRITQSLFLKFPNFCIDQKKKILNQMLFNREKSPAVYSSIVCSIREQDVVSSVAAGSAEVMGAVDGVWFEDFYFIQRFIGLLSDLNFEEFLVLIERAYLTVGDTQKSVELMRYAITRYLFGNPQLTLDLEQERGKKRSIVIPASNGHPGALVGLCKKLWQTKASGTKSSNSNEMSYTFFLNSLKNNFNSVHAYFPPEFRSTTSYKVKTYDQEWSVKEHPEFKADRVALLSGCKDLPAW